MLSVGAPRVSEALDRIGDIPIVDEAVVLSDIWCEAKIDRVSIQREEPFVRSLNLISLYQ